MENNLETKTKGGVDDADELWAAIEKVACAAGDTNAILIGALGEDNVAGALREILKAAAADAVLQRALESTAADDPLRLAVKLLRDALARLSGVEAPGQPDTGEASVAPARTTPGALTREQLALWHLLAAGPAGHA